MSTQSYKKKRLASRRRAANKDEEAADSTSVGEHQMPEENAASLNELAYPDNSQSEIQNPPSPHFSGSRRKLGSSRKRQQHVHMTSTELHHKTKEEHETSRGNERPEMSLVIQVERQEELGHGGEHDQSSATHDGSMYSETGPCYSPLVQNLTTKSSPEADLKSLCLKTKNLKADQEENETDCDSGELVNTPLEGIEKCDTAQSVKEKECAHLADISEFTSVTVLSGLTVHQQLINQSNSTEIPEGKLPNVYSSTEKEIKTQDDESYLLKQDGNVQSKYMLSESYVESVDVEFSIAPEIATEKSSTGEHTESKYSVEKATLSSLKKKLTKYEEEEEISNVFAVKNVRQSEDALSEVHEHEIKPSQLHGMYHSSHSTKKSKLNSGRDMDEAEVSDTYKFEVVVNSNDAPATTQQYSNPDDKAINKQEKEGTLSEDERKSYIEIQQTRMDLSSDAEPQDKSVAQEELTHTDFNPIENRGEMESSRINKGRQVLDALAESKYEDECGQEVLETARVHEALERRHTLMDTPGTFDNSLYSNYMPDYSPEVQSPIKYPESELESFISKSQNLQEKPEVIETDLKVEVSDNSVGGELEGIAESDTLKNEEIQDAPVSDIEMVETALGQRVYENEGRVNDDITPSFNQTYTLKERQFGESENVDEMEESECYLHTEQSEISSPLDSQLQQNDTGFNPMTAVQEKSTISMLEGMDTFDTVQTEEAYDQIQDNANVRISKHLPVSSISTIEQNLIEPSKTAEMPDELPNDYYLSEREHEGIKEDTELPNQDEHLQDIYVVRESHEKIEEKELLIPLEITKQKSSLGEHTESECSVEEATLSSPKKEIFNVSEVEGAQHSEGTGSEVHKEINPTQVHDIDDFSINENYHATESSELFAGREPDKAKVSDTYEFQLAVNSTDDYVTKHQVSNAEEKGVKEQAKEGTISEDESNLSMEIPQSGENSLSKPQENPVTTEEQTATDFNPIGKRKKMGSSRRNKGRQQVMEVDVESNHEHKQTNVESARVGEALETRQMLLAIEKTSGEELSQGSDYDNVMPGINDNSFYSAVLPGCSFEAHTLTTKSCTDSKLESLVPKGQILQDNHAVIETDLKVEVSDKSVRAELEGMDNSETLQIQEGAHHLEDVVNIVHYQDIKPAQIQENMNTDKTLNMHPTEEKNFEDHHANNAKTTQVGDTEVVETALGQACENEGRIEEQSKLEFKQKRRKLGSVCQTQHNRKPEGDKDNKDETKESDLNIELDMMTLDQMEVQHRPVHERQETNETCRVQERGPKLQSSTSDLQSIEIDTISGMDDLQAFLPEECAPQYEEVVNPDTFIHNSDHVKDCERNVDENVEPDDVTGARMHTTSVLADGSSYLMKSLLSSNTRDAAHTGFTGGFFASLSDTTQSTEKDEQMPESVDAIHDQILKSAEAHVVAVSDLEIVNSVCRGEAEEEHEHDKPGTQEPNNVEEGAHNTKPGMKNASPNSASPNRRRKLGSSRRNLGSRNKREALHHEQKDNETMETARNAEDVKTECSSGIKVKELPLPVEHKQDSDPEQKKEKVLEVVGECHKSPAHQNLEGNSVSHGQLVQIEHHVAPDCLPAMPSTSPKHDTIPQSPSGGRRRKMGSHRKSHGPQHIEKQTAREDEKTVIETERDVQSSNDKTAIQTSEAASMCLNQILEVEKMDMNASSNITTSKAGMCSRPVSEKTPAQVAPVQKTLAEKSLTQNRQKTLPLAGNLPADYRSNSYNVVMIGDSSVGKSSYMKRVQSGTFSLNVPASVGLDSCLWTVLVDGKPVVLKLWDTAGQERFHSITRQIFHKAQAFLLMYDITAAQSFSAVNYWASCIKEGAPENTTILLLGNKSDHADRQVKTLEGETLAKENNFEFMECSAATGENVMESLETMARILSRKADLSEEAMVLHKEPPQKKSSGCC